MCTWLWDEVHVVFNSFQLGCSWKPGGKNQSSWSWKGEGKAEGGEGWGGKDAWVVHCFRYCNSSRQVVCPICSFSNAFLPLFFYIILLGPLSFFVFSMSIFVGFPLGPSVCRLARQSRRVLFCVSFHGYLYWFYCFLNLLCDFWFCMFHELPFSVLLMCLEWFSWFVISGSSSKLAVPSVYYDTYLYYTPWGPRPVTVAKDLPFIYLDRRLPLISCWDCNRLGAVPNIIYVYIIICI